jgi:hypothetical protein
MHWTSGEDSIVETLYRCFQVFLSNYDFLGVVATIVKLAWSLVVDAFVEP